MEIKNLKKAAERIKKAIKNKEKIILYGDADLDGVTSVIILKESIKNLGGETAMVYFPDRDKDGYGLNQKALNFLKKTAPGRRDFVSSFPSLRSGALLILLDCGISNFKEAKLAKKLGFDLVIVDHHEILDKLPQASIIVDPKQPRDKYPFKGLANAGIVFKLSLLLFAGKIPQQLKKSFLELTALATMADMMPQINENKIFIEEGLDSLKKTFRPGLEVFWKINNTLRGRGIKEISQKIISTLNSSNAKDNLNTTYLLLTSGDKKMAEKLARELEEQSYQKQIRIREMTNEAEEQVLRKLGEPLVFEGFPFWQTSLLGPVASRICQRYQKPTFIFKKGEKESVGATRTPRDINGVQAMKRCSKFLKTFGGHPLAAGFTIKNENLEKFKTCLTKYFSNLTTS